MFRALRTVQILFDMKISIEISMYPLNKNYGTPILQFIENLRQYSEIAIKSNNMSSQIFGEYDVVIDILKIEMKKAFLTESDVAMVLKIVNMDLS